MPENVIVLQEAHLAEIKELVFDRPGLEGAAFVLCGSSVSEDTNKLLSRHVVPVAPEDYLVREATRLSISGRALTRVAKMARRLNLSILFVHSHPEGVPDFSAQDDREEQRLIPFFQARVPARIHGTAVLTQNTVAGRIYAPERFAATRVVAIGSFFRIFVPGENAPDYAIFDRQVRAFGPEVQRAMRAMHIGVVGVGGTGSPTAEQLYRLGFGRISLFDGDSFHPTNVNRVYGSRLRDAGRPKVEISKAHLDEIGLTTTIRPVPEHITSEAAALKMRDCDVIFCCTDKEWPRAIITTLARQYLIPVFDLGVLINSEAGVLKDVHGRVTTMLPGEACLFCRGRISAEMVRLESLSPQDRKAQILDGYAPELDEPAPAVISFTSSIASAAITELIHRLTAFMGKERLSTEVLYRFDASVIRTNRVAPRPECACADPTQRGSGDEQPFLGMVWANHTR